MRYDGHQRLWYFLPPVGRPRLFCSTALVDKAMGDAPYRRRHENRAGGGVEPNNPPWLLVRKNIVILGAASHGLHRRLWAVRGPSARGHALTGPWATPPTAGNMKIKQGWMYYPTIHHVYLLEKNRHPGRRQPWPPSPPLGRRLPFRGWRRFSIILIFEFLCRAFVIIASGLWCASKYVPPQELRTSVKPESGAFPKTQKHKYFLKLPT